MNAVATFELSYHYRAGEEVLRALDLEVPAGTIYGFLGPNGAGKTTTLRLLLGLLRRQQGRIEVFGLELARHREEILRRLGSSIETPSLYAHLTAKENLALWQTVFRCPRRRVAEVLALVGLGRTGSKRAGDFSLGMKQRLSLAVALLHEPELLILDEPTNGLDPHGILEMRDLLLTLNRERGTTIVVSSHLLPEVERLITHVGILHHGALVFQGPLAALVERLNATSHTAFGTSDDEATLALLSAAGYPARRETGRIVVPALPWAEAARLNRRLVLAGIDVHGIATERMNLEQIYLSLVQD